MTDKLDSAKAPSKGAMIAADTIWGQMSNKSRALSSLSLQSITGIIDRETKAPQMAELLRCIVEWEADYCRINNLSGHPEWVGRAERLLTELEGKL